MKGRRREGENSRLGRGKSGKREKGGKGRMADKERRGRMIEKKGREEERDGLKKR